MIRKEVAALARGFSLDYWLEKDEKAEYPHEFIKAFADAGWLGLMVPEAYGGSGLAAGTNYWRVRHWDQHGGLSDWSDLARIVLTTSFNPLPGTQTSIQVDSKAPWRVRVMEMKFNSLASITGAITSDPHADGTGTLTLELTDGDHTWEGAFRDDTFRGTLMGTIELFGFTEEAEGDWSAGR